MKAKRQSTVEPLFGILTQFTGLRKINTMSIKQANKVMYLSVMAYFLKKYLKFITKPVKSDAKVMCHLPSQFKTLFISQISIFITFSIYKKRRCLVLIYF
ncbi:MAG: hypothetical protein WC389_05930 [Lutibacter sp.]|jgi:hypothetical protein